MTMFAKWVGTVLLASTALLGATAANAQSLPSSSTPASGEWTKMRPSSFAGTVDSAVEQCGRNAALRSDDLLTPEKCEVYRQKLQGVEGRDYQIVMVRDGVVHDLMNARSNGQSSVTFNVEKKLSRLDRALLVDLGDGVFAYWYTGILKVSCNNVAFSIVVPTVAQIAPPKLVAPPAKKCRIVAVPQAPSTASTTFLPGFVIPTCCPTCTPPTFVPGMLQNGNNSGQSVTYVTVCE